MSAILEIDRYQRRIISVIFRFLIICYSIFLLIFHKTSIEWYINVSIFVVYLFIYFLLSKRNKIASIFRLLNDYIFITFILYQVNSIDIYTLALLFGPILNTHNHSGEKRSLLLYVLPILSLYFLDWTIEKWYVVPFLFFLFINAFDSLRTRYFRFHQKLNIVIDDFFINESSVSKPYKIYEVIIPILNNSRLLGHDISKIVCVKIDENKVSVINGSNFIWNFSIQNKKEFLDKVKNSQILYNVEVNINNDLIKNNIIIVCRLSPTPYCFILMSENFKSFYNLPFLFFIPKLLYPFFFRLSKVLDADLSLKKNESNKLNELEDKISYVANSVNTMHFIRNKLSPFKNYLATIDDYFQTKDITKKKKIEKYLIKNRPFLGTTITLILEKANYILTKSNNPFNVYVVDLFDVQQLFSDIRRIWNYYFEEDNFEILWDVKNKTQRYDVKYNKVGMELVLTNWINNMEKYNSGRYGIKFTETEDEYLITFHNSLDCSMPNALKFVEDFNTSDRTEIIKRSTSGLIEIKDFVVQMGISVEMFVVSDVVYFLLKFKKYLCDESASN